MELHQISYFNATINLSKANNYSILNNKFAPFTSTKLAQTLQLIGKKSYLHEQKDPKGSKYKVNTEKKALTQWVNIHCWDKQGQLRLQLFQKVMKYFPNFDSPHLSSQQLMKTIYAKELPHPNEEEAWKKLGSQFRKLQSDLTTIVQDFLVYYRVKQNADFRKELLIQEYLERGKTEWFFKESDDAIQKLEGKAGKEITDYHKLASYYSMQFMEPTGKRRNHPNYKLLDHVETNLDLFFALNKSVLLNENSKRSGIYNLETKQDDISIISSWLDKVAEKYNHRSLMIFQKNLSKNPNYEILTTDFFTHLDAISHLNRKRILFWLINGFNKLYANGDSGALKKMTALFDKGIEKELIIQYGQISDRTFFNMITVNNLIGRYKQSQSIAERFLHYLPKSIQQPAKEWAVAHGAFHSGNEVNLEMISYPENGINHLFVFKIRTLQIKSGFERFKENEFGLAFFLNSLELCKRWSKRDKISSQSSKKAFTNFIKIVGKIANAIRNGKLKNSDRVKLLHEINATTPLDSKDWLIQQIEKLS